MPVRLVSRTRHRSSEGLRRGATYAALALLIVSVALVVVAWGSAFLACDDPTAASCKEQGLLVAAIVDAAVSIPLVVLFLVCVARNRRGLAVTWLVATLGAYATWVVLFVRAT